MPKRTVDIFFSTLGLLLLSPLLAMVSILIRRDGGPAFFKQERVGLNGRIFRIYKFRTMMERADQFEIEVTAGDDQRITPIGSFLRKYKIDELPQLINVFFGHMSLVGPRPEVPGYVKLWPEKEKQVILSVKPGITDYASLLYKNEQDDMADSLEPEKKYIEEIMPLKLKLYIKYVQERNLFIDFQIILKTVLSIFRQILKPMFKYLPISSFAKTYSAKK